VLAGSRAGDIVFDPFFGSGTTGQVASRLGRHFIGCELNRDYGRCSAIACVSPASNSPDYLTEISHDDKRQQRSGARSTD
jgi:hypothetical protein